MREAYLVKRETCGKARLAAGIIPKSDRRNPGNQRNVRVHHLPRSLSDIAVRDEAKEVRPDARPQAWKNRRCIRWNTSRIFSGRERRRWSQIVRRSRTVNVGQAPRHDGWLTCYAARQATAHMSTHGLEIHRGGWKTKVYEHNDPASLSPRPHPWIDGESDPTHRYYDFRRRPELIRSSLEDMQEWSAYPVRPKLSIGSLSGSMALSRSLSPMTVPLGARQPIRVHSPARACCVPGA
jgi:hypothetical protein